MSRFADIVNVFTNLWNRPRIFGDSLFYSLQGDTFNSIDLAETFRTIPEVNAIINKKASAFSNGAIKVVNRNLKPVEKNDVLKRLENPNWFQDQKEFMRQCKLWHEIFGEEFMYFSMPVGFTEIQDSNGLFALPPDQVIYELKAKQPFFQYKEIPSDLIKLQYELNDEKYTLDSRNIIHLNENRVKLNKRDQKDMLRGESKLVALKAPINNIRMAYESRGVILKHRGAIGILSNEGKDSVGITPIKGREKKEIQNSFANNYGTLNKQSQIIITNASLKWQSMMVNNPKNLGLYEEVQESVAALLDSFNMPKNLFAGSGDNTYENVNQARKDVYENAIVPEANEWIFALNQKFFQDTPHKLIVDYSHLPIFQEDIKHRTEALSGMVNALSLLLQDQQITSDEYREELAKLKIGTGSKIVVEGAVQIRQAQAQLRGSVGGVQGILSIQAAVSAGTSTRESAVAMLIYVYGFTQQEADALIGQPKQEDTNEQEQQTEPESSDQE